MNPNHQLTQLERATQQSVRANLLLLLLNPCVSVA
jgi:hypothetical protein